MTQPKNYVLMCAGCKCFFTAFENDCKCGYTNIDPETGMVKQ